MRLSILLVFAFVIGLYGEGASAKDIDAAEAALDVASPLLHGMTAKFERDTQKQNAGHYDKGHWRGKGSNAGFAVVERFIPKGGRWSFGRWGKATVKSYVFDAYTYTKDKSFKGNGPVAVSDGMISGEYELFSVHGRPCLAFVKNFGGPGKYAPANNIYGFYCGSPSDTLTIQQAAEFFNLTTQKRAGTQPQIIPATVAEQNTPQQASASSSRIPFAMNWDGQDGLISGYMTHDGQSDGGALKLTIPSGITKIKCTGAWVHQGGDYKGDIKPHGKWNVVCSNGGTASGVFISSAPQIGSGSGVDDKGKRIAVTFGSG